MQAVREEMQKWLFSLYLKDLFEHSAGIEILCDLGDQAFVNRKFGGEEISYKVVAGQELMNMIPEKDGAEAQKYLLDLQAVGILNL